MLQSVKGAQGVSFFTPKQPILGKFVKYLDASKLENTNDTSPPLLFTPLKIRSLTIPNRIVVSPMCTYSSTDSSPTIFHTVHYGSLSMRGPGLIIVEFTSISEKGKFSFNDLGLWNDQLASDHYTKIVEFVHSQNGKIGIQLGQFINENNNSNTSDPPFLVNTLTTSEIDQMITNWGVVCQRAIHISKYDFIEIQASHGYIFQQFLSPLFNHRSDSYNGDLKERMSFLIKVVDEIRSKIPSETPIFIRLPDCDKSESICCLTQEDTSQICIELVKHGIDVFDFVCVNPGHLKIPGYQNKTSFLRKVRHSLKEKGLSAKICSPSKITSAKEAETILQSGEQDLIIIGSQFLQNPVLVTDFADQLNIQITQPVQYSWGFYPTKKQLEDVKTKSE